MQTTEMKSVYFVGAGGIGMSALVRYFLTKGYNVGGYDKTPSELTEKLIEEGAKIHYEENVEAIDPCFKQKESTLVVYTPAIPAEHKEMVYFRENGFEIQYRAQVLGFLTQSHGTNYILSDSDYVVIEADEFDRSFHWLRPYMTVITATDPDHLDIYGTKEAYLESFRKYTTLIQPGGALIIHKGLEMKADVQEGVKVYEYAREEGDFHAENIRIGGGEIVFDFVHPNGVVKDIQLGVPVSINIENGIAAMALAILNGVTDEELREGMKSFRGVDRRFDFKVKNDQMVFLSDYAHHPNEIEQSVKSVRELYQDKKIAAIFQPHLYTRTRDFYKEFASALSLLDCVYLCDIYPARELPIEGVTSKLIYDNLRPGIEKHLIHKEDILDVARSKNFDVLMSLGAGDIENYVPQITEILSE